MFKKKTLLALALCSTLAAISTSASASTSPSAQGQAQPLGSSWSDIEKLPKFFDGSWQSRASFLDPTNSTPFTPEAQAYIAQFKAIEDIPFAGPGCPTPGMPMIQRLGSPIKFFYEPGMIAIYIENSSMTRFIKLNTKHPERPNPSYLGESIGHFEGDTLVVDSIAFADDLVLQYTNFPGMGLTEFILPPESIFGPHGPNLRMVERFRLLDDDTLELQTTIYDDTVWTEPYVSSPAHIFKRSRGEEGIPREWVCGSDDPLEFDPISNETTMADPAEVLRRIQQNDRKN